MPAGGGGEEGGWGIWFIRSADGSPIRRNAHETTCRWAVAKVLSGPECGSWGGVEYVITGLGHTQKKNIHVCSFKSSRHVEDHSKLRTYTLKHMQTL